MIYSILERIVETDRIRFGYFYFQQKNIKITRKSIDKNKWRRYNKTIERR
nr:MAG TPA: hypothetical protein [Caudoviricetes sp.]